MIEDCTMNKVLRWIAYITILVGLFFMGRLYEIEWGGLC